MPFTDEPVNYGPLSIPEGLSVTPEVEEVNRSVLGAAFRQENPVVSWATSFSLDLNVPSDPDYRPWEQLQGTKYEPFAARFVGARTPEDVARMKLQIDGEEADRSVLAAAGWKGWGASAFAGLLSPTNLLPGGQVAMGAKGVSIARTAFSVAASTAAAAAIDEAVLSSTQQLRTGAESAYAIGGSAILGGFLGAGLGKMGALEFRAASKQVEDAIKTTQEFDGAVRSLSAGSALDGNMKLRGEQVFQFINKVPGARVLVRTDPILRSLVSDLDSARRGTVELAETPLEFQVNAEGHSVRDSRGSVEARIRDRERTDLVQAISYLHRSYGEYFNDGPVGVIGTITAPITGRFQRLMGKNEKLTSSEFLDEVGKAMRGEDKHPIPQVQSAAEAIRSHIFDKVKNDAVDLGIFDEGLKLDNGTSYFTRVYNDEMIRQHFNDGSDKDLVAVLRREFMDRREKARTMLAEDDTLNRKEIDALRIREEIMQDRRTLTQANAKAMAKRGRADSSIAAGRATARSVGGLRKKLSDRIASLTEGVPDEVARKALKDAIKDARGVNRLRPYDILDAIRAKGGIHDPRSGGMWNGTGWGKGSKPTDLEMILDTKARTIRRDGGMSADYMREALVEDGYLPEGATINDLYDAIGRASSGEHVFSSHDYADVANWEAARDFRAELEALGVDVSAPLDKIVRKLHGENNSPRQKAKATEARRSEKLAAKAEGTANSKVMAALDRLDQAKARLAYLAEEVGPEVRTRIKANIKELDKIRSEISDAKTARNKEEFYASADDAAIETHVREAIQSILNMKPGESHAVHAFAKPTRARVLDVPDHVLEPWLESNVETVMHQYFRSMVPQMEMIRQFGDLQGTRALQAMTDEATVKMSAAKTAKEKTRIGKELEQRHKDFESMRDRILGTYGAPENPRSGWVKAGRVTRTVSYMGNLGGMTISAIPDVANTLGRSGLKGAFGAAATALTNPRRLFSSMREMAEYGAAAEWWLNSRATGLAEVFDRYGNGSKLEKMMAEGARHFSVATGMIPWNVGWKSVGGAAVASQMAKAAEAVRSGKATAKQLRILGANGIEPWMAERIAKQIEQFGDTNGILWLPQGGKWEDREAFEAFRRAMNREFDMMVVTPGQDKPLAFSTETGKFFLQFKSFGFSAYHRTLLAGLQRSDADTLAQFTMAFLLGGLVSNIKADVGGYDRKEGGRFWVDALDKSGLAGWMMEPYGIAAGAFPQLNIGETPSRFQGRSRLMGALGPSVDMALNIEDATGAFARGQATYRDVRKLMKPLPGNNHPALNGTHIFNLYSRLEDALVNATGAKPRQ